MYSLQRLKLSLLASCYFQNIFQNIHFCKKEHIPVMEGTDFNSLHSLKSLHHYNCHFPFSFTVSAHPHFSGNSTGIGCSGLGSKSWCPAIYQLRVRHRTQTKSHCPSGIKMGKSGSGTIWAGFLGPREGQLLISSCSLMARAALVPSFLSYHSNTFCLCL